MTDNTLPTMKEHIGNHSKVRQKGHEVMVGEIHSVNHSKVLNYFQV